MVGDLGAGHNQLKDSSYEVPTTWQPSHFNRRFVPNKSQGVLENNVEELKEGGAGVFSRM